MTLLLTIADSDALDTLPLLHRDPFDRLLVAQALAHGLTLVTTDDRLRQYPIPTL
jgi:PIN domain nuclease of toxin-antitoxin system